MTVSENGVSVSFAFVGRRGKSRGRSMGKGTGGVVEVVALALSFFGRFSCCSNPSHKGRSRT